MRPLIVAGSGTGVGKTVVSAILTTALQGEYWKPVQCGASDTAVMGMLIDAHRIHPSAYSFKAPVSPHQAARLKNRTIDLETIVLPKTTQPLVIESVGGILTPLSVNRTGIDLFKSWDARWILVSRHYLGSINHTLLTIDVLKRHQVLIAGLIFNGAPNPDSEDVILGISGLPLLARLFPEAQIDSKTIQRYAQQWNLSLK